MFRKRFGQHFLSDAGILDRIVDLAGVERADVVVEIGPGRGALTRRLAASARAVVAVEIDRDLIPPLRASMPDNVQVVASDALDIDYRTVAAPGYRLVANLPYNIATPLIERFVAARSSIASVTIMVQKEVADRILAAPGGRNYGPLSVGLQHYAAIDAGFPVPPGAFRPPPKVWSRMIRLEWKPGVRDADDFVRFVRNAFTARRKKLVNNLAAGGLGRAEAAALLEAAGVDADARPEELSPEQYFRVFSYNERRWTAHRSK